MKSCPEMKGSSKNQAAEAALPPGKKTISEVTTPGNKLLILSLSLEANYGVLSIL